MESDFTRIKPIPHGLYALHHPGIDSSILKWERLLNALQTISELMPQNCGLCEEAIIAFRKSNQNFGACHYCTYGLCHSVDSHYAEVRHKLHAAEMAANEMLLALKLIKQKQMQEKEANHG